MSLRALPPRALVVAAVIALHVGALLLLLTETRTHLVRRAVEASPLLAWLIEPRTPQHTAPLPPRASRAPRVPAAAPRPALPEAPSPITLPPAPPAAIDWAAEASDSAHHQLDEDAQRARQAGALAPKKSPVFAAQPKRHQFGWDPARTDPVQASGVAKILRVNDHCEVALLLFIPLGASCTLDKMPARGDLFDHMHDPEP